MHQRPSEIARTDNDGMKSAPDAEQITDPCVQVVDIVAVPLLTESAEAIEVLPDL